MLGYYKADTLVGNTSVCELNRLVWPVQPGLPETLDAWLTDITDYVRGGINPDNPVASPLGEDKLFLMSYAWNDPNRENYQTFYKPFYNAKVDLMDAHMYLRPDSGEVNQPDTWLKWDMDHTHGFLDRTPSAHFPAKPFNTGEFDYTTHFNGFGLEIEKIFHNYDVSFHNEIWASAFSGKWATGTTWQWERVFWWPDALPEPPWEPTNSIVLFHNPGHFSNVEGDTNVVDVGGLPVAIKNRTLYHHFKPLAELLARPSWQAYEFFSGNYSPHKVFNAANDLESYYLKNAANDVAIGWVHNRNAWVMNGYYLFSDSTSQNFLGCDPPNNNTITLTGFVPGTAFYVTWVPTHENSPILPPDTQITSTGSGTLTLNLTHWLGGTANNYLDTLRSDYAFIISPDGFAKSRHAAADNFESTSGWDFIMYPNPAHDDLFLRLPDDTPKEIVLLDLSGRRVQNWSSVTGPLQHLPVGDLAKGIYAVKVSDGTNAKTKKLIIH